MSNLDEDELDDMLRDILGSEEDSCSSEDSKDKLHVDNFAKAFHGEFANQEKEESDVEFSEDVAEECDSTLELNREIIRSLLELKQHVTSVLEKCEKKLEIVESRLREYTWPDMKILISNAGMPYFKDRNYFFPPSNDDELLKEARGELQVDNLPKVSSWTSKERNTLLKAIKQDAIAAMLKGNADNTNQEDGVEKNTRKTKTEENAEVFLPSNFKLMVGPLGSREFDWFKIAAAHFEDRHQPIDCWVMWNVFLHPDINKNSWKKPEDSRLKEIARRYKFQDWDGIAKELGTNRTAYQCFIRYNTTKKLPNVRNCIWSKEEDKQLHTLVEIFKIGDFVPWGEVAGWMRNRTKQQVYFRWTYSLAPYLVKGRFTKKEDKTLKEAVTMYGKNFRKISAALMPNRSTIQLNDHYQRLSTKQVQKSKGWTSAEDKKLMKLYERIGPHWSKIAKAFSCKTRTQLRHRYSALRRYSKRGRIYDDIDDEDEGKKRLDGEYMLSDSLADHEDFTDEVDAQILRYFHDARTEGRQERVRRIRSPDELEDSTKKLYDILRVLNAKLDIPDEVEGLSEREEQLLSSLKRYASVKNDKERNRVAIERCGLHMFGTQSNEQDGPRFIPPPPFDVHMRIRKPKITQEIDYRLNMDKEFLIEKDVDTETPEFVVSFIGGEEQELQFRKISRLFESSCPRRLKTVVKKLYILPPQILLENRAKTNSQNVAPTHSTNLVGASYRREELSKIAGLSNLLLEEPVNVPSVPYVETPPEERKVPAIQTTHATLSSYKNLIYLKRLFDKSNKRNSALHEINDGGTVEFEEAYNLLETRLERLFKYPIGMSRTTLPQVYSTDTLFELDEKSKRKAKTTVDNPTKKVKVNKRGKASPRLTKKGKT